MRSSSEPLEQGLPADVLAIAKTKAEKRTDEQKLQLAAYYRTIDLGLLKQQQALAKAKFAVPEDPKLKELKRQKLKLKEQIVRVERVNVESGGQAVVGHVQHGGREDGQR